MPRGPKCTASPANQGLLKEAGKSLPRAGAVFQFYDFCRIHKTLKVTPATAAGVTTKLWSMEDIVALIDARDERRAKKTT